MALVTYEARRSLAPGHVLSEDYSLRLTLMPQSERSVRDLKTSQQSLSGRTETQFFGQQTAWTITLAPADFLQAELIREFLDSTADGQQFTFDPYGTEAKTSNWLLTVVRDDDGYRESRVIAVGRGGEDDFIQFSFGVKAA